MATVKLRDVRKAFGAIEVIKGVTVDIADGEFVILVGPSGCGKSTLLRMIAGLEDVTSGDVAIADRRINHVAPKDRDIAMVFQNYALYPHMTVAQNMGFSLKLAGVPKPKIREQVEHAAESLGLTPYLDRYPKELSGGQRQRVATGRAIVRNPAVFLFDEPLSNLDAALRVQMRSEIRELQRRLGVTSIYVTHDQVEAMTMADKIVVLRDGLVEQVGAPLELYDRPANVFVATFIGSPSMNMFECDATGGTLKLFGDVALPLPDGVTGEAGMSLGIRPDAIEVVAEQTPGAFQAQVTSLEATGSETMLFAVRDGIAITVVTKARLASGAGDQVWLRPDAGAMHLFGADGQRVN
ncbi:ABC transporter ATP-binding protein [Maritimibacter fusiformis]|uniref:sn-glycerol-3-phosphate ABC transporter ATP-binding protein UgpC n=1 Tax=Maritimibacter fusiformis TaxID=2603819 RepID=A0A5D0RA65_9RHOB|nr:sn-glycerol-3-phosphate ABC transporter ATP-binding protein UgpC [Maritimibacter fusiformis]TYB77588.1 sn-glycerol-3-phosphate ABC transporter ATP-binding protein UgpC [Maritimibacter fusiformis]